MANTFINKLFRDPIKEIKAIRDGLRPQELEGYLSAHKYVMKDVLERLNIPASTYKSKKRNNEALDSAASEKLMRLVSVTKVAGEIIGESETKDWLYREIPSLGNRKPIDLLDTEVGHRLVEQALQQIKYGVYS
tara:strand:- start:1666 stop:2067 length:402 start_codon:yes stop_codon:yes gene_type:complete